MLSYHALSIDPFPPWHCLNTEPFLISYKLWKACIPDVVQREDEAAQSARAEVSLMALSSNKAHTSS